MGTGMAKNLVAKGFKLMVYDIRDEALREMTGLGAEIAGTEVKGAVPLEKED
jgi:3-hydroxyisobutyrate dehydrogenase-like beta-hydroxyacid dehydrogenase